jgi:hypothetical protein
VANVWRSLEMVAGKDVGKKRAPVVGEMRHGGLLQNNCWGTKWDVRGERAV